MRATTGLSLEAFGKLTDLFTQSYLDCHEISLKKKLENLSVKTVLTRYEEMLFFVLFQSPGDPVKNGLTYDVLDGRPLISLVRVGIERKRTIFGKRSDKGSPVPRVGPHRRTG